MAKRISFQGELGANSHIACRKLYPELEPLPCPTFEDAFAAVSDGEALYAMIPIENSIAGRVADVHHLIPESNLFVIGEHFMPIRYNLLAVKGATLDDLKSVRSHIQTLGQCRRFLRTHNIAPHTTADNAGAAREVSQLGDKSQGALATALAGEIYGLEALKTDVADEGHNTTRFLIFSKTPQDAELGDGPCVTSFVFRVRNIPAALYKALGGFATNGVNMTKLESYLEGGAFSAAMFFAEIEGHPDEHNVKLALEELTFFSAMVKVLGVYPADPFRGT